MVPRSRATTWRFARFVVGTVLAFLEGSVGQPAKESLKPVRVFTKGAEGITCFRIPAVIKSKKGVLLAFAEARYGSCLDGAVRGIVVSRSTDLGSTWSAPVYAAGSEKHIVGNPSAVALEDGRVAVVYMVHNTHLGPNEGIDTGIVWSSDEGATWSPEQNVSKDFGVARGGSPGPGQGIQLASGRLLVVSHMGGYREDYVTYSDDGGKTWTTVNHKFPKMDEATMADLGNNNVLLNMRHMKEQTMGRGVARSSDGGLTWSEITYDSALFGPICQASIAGIGKRVYFSNPASKTRSRDHLTIRRSDDGGHTWDASLLVQAGPSAGYSSLVPAAINEKYGGILYESEDGGNIDFALFPLDFGTSVVHI